MFSFLKKITSPFSRMKSALGKKIRALFSHSSDESAFDALEQLFYEADLGPSMATELVEKLKQFSKKNKDSEAVLPFLKGELLSLFKKREEKSRSSPWVILVVGVNGSGKTTTVAKLASRFRKEGKTVCIAAADTFRAAAVEQLEIWAKRVGADLIKSQSKSDPSSIAFDALVAAKARKTDIVLIDTAGRLQTKTDLMQELSKIGRVCQKLVPEAPHETLLVLDATLGQNALDQARVFHQFTPLTGVVLTKLDGSAKGGIAAAITKELSVPILWAGLGEGEEDLIPFDPQSYVDALFE